jgi:hypothetical protein
MTKRYLWRISRVLWLFVDRLGDILADRGIHRNVRD